MDIQNQVCTFEQAKTLKSLGVSQAGSFYWLLGKGATAIPCVYSGWAEFQTDCVSAYSTAELGEMMPCRFEYNQKQCSISSEKYVQPGVLFYEGSQWIAGIHSCYKDPEHPSVPQKYFPGRTAAECLADVLIFCMENKIPGFTPEEVNVRLKNK